MNTYKIRYNAIVTDSLGDEYEVGPRYDRVMAASPADAGRKLAQWWLANGQPIRIVQVRNEDARLNRAAARYERARA